MPFAGISFFLLWFMLAVTSAVSSDIQVSEVPVTNYWQHLNNISKYGDEIFLKLRVFWGEFLFRTVAFFFTHRNLIFV